jgi:hypothetical protein
MPDALSNSGRRGTKTSTPLRGVDGQPLAGSGAKKIHRTQKSSQPLGWRTRRGKPRLLKPKNFLYAN